MWLLLAATEPCAKYTRAAAASPACCQLSQDGQSGLPEGRHSGHQHLLVWRVGTPAAWEKIEGCASVRGRGAWVSAGRWHGMPAAAGLGTAAAAESIQSRRRTHCSTLSQQQTHTHRHTNRSPGPSAAPLQSQELQTQHRPQLAAQAYGSYATSTRAAAGSRDSGPIRHAVQPRQLLSNDAALQPRMDGLHLRLLACRGAEWDA